jgi:hypothetical protein
LDPLPEWIPSPGPGVVAPVSGIVPTIHVRNSVRGGAFENVGRQVFPELLKNKSAVFGKLIKGEGWKSSVPDWLTLSNMGDFKARL